MRLSLKLVPLLGALAASAPAHAQTSQPAPPFAVRDLEGRTVKLQDLKGKPVVLDFWATWCAPCRASMPELDAIQDRYADRGLVVLGLSLDEEGSAPVKKFVDRLGVKFRIALANERMLAQYGPIRSAPTTVFINRKGMVVRRVVGYVDRETMESFILELF